MIYVIHVYHDLVAACGVARAILPLGLLREINGCVVVRTPQRGVPGKPALASVEARRRIR
jgi:hypothetical protein